MGEIEKINLISNIGYIAAAAFLLLAIVLFFVFNIKKIIMDKTGITEKRAIKQINEENRKITEGGSVMTDKISKSGRINGIPITSKIPTGQIDKGNETTVLGQAAMSNETTLLSQPASNETTILSQSNETTLLSGTTFAQTEQLAQPMMNNVVNTQMTAFAIVQEITFVHTNVVIN